MAERGRPSEYTAEVATAICARLASGETLRAICRDDGMPAESTVRGWALDDREGFAAQYARSREIGYMAMADEALEIADDGSNDTYKTEEGQEATNHDVIARSRLRVDTRKWLLSKALPKVFGDKIVQEHTGAGGGPIETSITRIERVIVDAPKQETTNG
jgi:hypothetical protein